MLILLALATFLDGIYVNWRFCVVGLVLAVGVVVVAWLDDWALGIFLIGLVGVALAVLYMIAISARTKSRPRPASRPGAHRHCGHR